VLNIDNQFVIEHFKNSYFAHSPDSTYDKERRNMTLISARVIERRPDLARFQ
jgi:hypothetical protein